MHLRRNFVKEFSEANAEHERRASELGLPWELKAAAIVERTPVVVPEMEKWEHDFMKLQESLEYFKGYNWPEGIGTPHPDTVDPDDPSMKLPLDLAPRITAADEAGDMASLERALPESLYLMVQTSPGEWGFPEVTLKDGEMLGQAAERAAAESATKLPRLFFFRKQPLGHMWRAYDEAKQEASGVYGAKVFFYSGLVVNPYESIFAGDVQSAGAPYTGLEWRRKEEVASAQSDEKLGAYFGHLLCG